MNGSYEMTRHEMAALVRQTRDCIQRALALLPEAIDMPAGSTEARTLYKLRDDLRQSLAHCAHLQDLA